MNHLTKLVIEPGSLAADHWKNEIIVFLGSAQDRFTPSMRLRIDLSKHYTHALKSTADLARAAGIDLPMACPFALDDLLAEDTDPGALATRLM